MPEVMIQQVSGSELEDERYMKMVKDRFDPKLPIREHYEQRDDITYFRQEMTGERMLERITEVGVHRT